MGPGCLGKACPGQIHRTCEFDPVGPIRHKTVVKSPMHSVDYPRDAELHRGYRRRVV